MKPKFRAWDKINNEMISWGYLLNGYNLRNVFMRTEMCGLVLMQSTGLKDKNGVDIYEGDIVKPDRGVPFTVRQFIHEQGVFKIALITSGGHGFDGIYHGSELEVIGNRYENPELLEEE